MGEVEDNALSRLRVGEPPGSDSTGIDVQVCASQMEVSPHFPTTWFVWLQVSFIFAINFLAFGSPSLSQLFVK